MTEKDMEALLTSYKRDFFAKTGKGLKITVANRWESACELPAKFNPDDIVDLFCEFIGWEKKHLFVRKRREAMVKNRQLLMLILYSNGMRIVPIARLFSMDHTNILDGLKSINTKLNSDKYLQVYLKEIIEYIIGAANVQRIIVQPKEESIINNQS